MIRWFVPVTASFLIGCSGGSENSTDLTNTTSTDTPTNITDIIPPEDINEPTPPEDIPEPIITILKKDCRLGSSILKGKVIDIYEKAIANALIEVNGCISYSDINGEYVLYNLVEDDKALINITSKNYSQSAIPIKLNNNLVDSEAVSNNYIITVLSKSTIVSYESSIDLNEVDIKIPANTYYYADGYEYTGKVSLQKSSNKVDTKEYRRNFPGEFSGVNSNGVLVNFESFGMFQLSIQDEVDKDIYLNTPINITFNSVNSTDETIPLWSYDSYSNLWEEKGVAERQDNGSYLAEIKQIGIWSINKELEEEMGTYKGRIVDINGDPVPNVRVYMTGTNWIQSSLVSDVDGGFEIPIKANVPLSIHAFTFKDNFLAEYTGENLAPVGAGEIFDDRS